MVREGRVHISSATRAAFGSSYVINVFEPGAQVASASSGTVATVRAGHGLAADDYIIVATSDSVDVDRYRRVVSVTSTTVTLNSAVSLAAGEFLVNLGQDTGASGPFYDGSTLTGSIYTDMDYTTAAQLATVTADSKGRYRYWHKGIARWELVRTSTGTPVALYQDTGNQADEDLVSYGVRYAHLFATSGTGTEADPWVTSGSNPVQAAYDDLPAQGVGGGGVVRMIPGVYDLGSDDVAVDITEAAHFLTGVTIEGYSYGIKSSNSASVANDGAVILTYSGTGAAFKVGHFATTNTYWAEGLTFRGFKLRQTGTAGTGTGILGRIVRYSRFQDLTINDFSTGIGMCTVSDFNIFDNLRVNHNTAYGLDLGRATDELGAATLTPNGQCNANRITNCDFRNGARDNGATAWGVYIHTASVGNIIEGCEFHDYDTSGYGGIFIDAGTFDSLQTVVRDSYFEGNYVGVYHNNPSGSGVLDASGLLVEGNYFTQIEAYGVWVNSGSTGITDGVVIQGNSFVNPSSASPYNSSRGIQLGTYVQNFKVGPNVYLVQSPIGHTLSNSNVAHGSLGTLTDDQIVGGTFRVTGAAVMASTLAVTTTATAATLTSTGAINVGTMLRFGTASAITIASGVAARTKSYHTVTGEGGAADDLVTITAGADGDILVLRATSDSVTITVKHGTGNIYLTGAADFALDTNKDVLMLLCDGTNWLEMPGRNAA